VFNTKWVIFKLYHGKNMLHFNDMMIMTYLYLNSTLIWIFHWNNSPHVDMSLNSDTFSWSWSNQSMLLLLNAVWLAEKQQIPILLSL
jgi:hypothetical protein